jgi:transposase InsO family protein
VDKARYLIEAHVLEGRSVSELAAAHGVHRSWIYKLLARYREGGLKALEARSRRPRSCPAAIGSDVEEAILKLRSALQTDGHDAGAHTIAAHLASELQDVPSPSTIWRILKRHGLISPQPQKRPLCSLRRFEADLPNEMWQADITYWRLADGQHVEILNMIDDHSRLFLASEAYLRTKAQDVVSSFHRAASLHGLPASLLSDNGAVFTATPRRGKVLLQTELERLGIASKNSRPYHPQTCGKVELDAFAHYYNHIRPHRALGGRTPLQAYSTRVKARPAGTAAAPHFRVRQDKVDQTGKVSLRYESRLYKIGLGRAHKGRSVRLLIADQSIRVIDLEGQLIRELTLDPKRNYQPLTHG